MPFTSILIFHVPNGTGMTLMYKSFPTEMESSVISVTIDDVSEIYLDAAGAGGGGGYYDHSSTKGKGGGGPPGCL